VWDRNRCAAVEYSPRMSARAAVSGLVTATLAPSLKAAGFRKQALTFERRRGDVTQIVNVQVSHGGRSFYVNVGLIVDAVTALGGDTTGSLVLGAHVVHLGRRLHQLVPGLPESWAADDAAAGDAIARALATVVATLDGIDGALALLAAFPLDAGFEKVLRAQLKWTLGDRGGARADLEAVARELADRGFTVAALAKQAGISAV
jgi:Domain of unknown function (DUF4304)